MAHPITFTPQPVDPKEERMRQLASAPRDHAEALLVLYDLLDVAHEKGVLDLLRGIVGGRDVLAETLSEGMAMPETIAAARNGIALVRLLAAIDPELLQRIAKSVSEAAAPQIAREKQETMAKTAPLSAAAPLPGHPAGPSAGQAKPAVTAPRLHEPEPPSLWQLFRRITSKDGRRGLAFAVNSLTAVGRALRPEDKQR
jgi:uncharacterized protein YjgD (DUF1641 family)